MAEFAYNSAKSETTGMSPFEANYGMLPKQIWEPLNKTPYVNPASSLLENVWKGTWERLRENILKAQIRTAKWHTLKRGKQPDFKVGDLVMIDKRNLSTWRPSKKLDHKKVGPFPIIKEVGKRAYRVQLPTEAKLTLPSMFNCWKDIGPVRNLVDNNDHPLPNRLTEKKIGLFGL